MLNSTSFPHYVMSHSIHILSIQIDTKKSTVFLSVEIHSSETKPLDTEPTLNQLIEK